MPCSHKPDNGSRAAGGLAGGLNVELICQDVGRYRFPDRSDGVLSTSALTLVPEYAWGIAAGPSSPAPGRRMAVLDLKRPDHCPRWLLGLGVWLTRSFGVTLDLGQRGP